MPISKAFIPSTIHIEPRVCFETTLRDFSIILGTFVLRKDRNAMHIRDLTTPNANITQGWVSQPNGRGTFDILQSCVITVLLCSWSVLVLHVPSPSKGRWHIFLGKMYWMAFTLIFPEVTSAVAAEQHESASQSVKDFALLQDPTHPQWTMRHAFFADMGGFFLHSPDFPPFPVDSQQMKYLVAKGYISFPDVDEETIKDKNKADGFARVIMILQTTWFFLQVVARAIQHLSVSTLELAVLGFVFCTYISTVLWWKKPLDVGTPIILKTDVLMADILLKAGDGAKEPYGMTPLDFVDALPSTSTVTPFWFALGYLFRIGVPPKNRPIDFFPNSRTTPPRGLGTPIMMFETIGAIAFVGIHLIGWNFTLPTNLELLFWRVANLTLVAIMVCYLLFLHIGGLIAARVGRILFKKDARTALDLLRLCPAWFLILTLGPVVGLYSIARLYVIVEALVGLRALPTDAYDTVDWTFFIPHM